MPVSLLLEGVVAPVMWEPVIPITVPMTLDVFISGLSGGVP